MNKITVTGYHKCLHHRTAQETGDIVCFVDPREAYKITSDIGAYIDSYGDVNYFLLDEIDSSEFTFVP